MIMDVFSFVLAIIATPSHVSSSFVGLQTWPKLWIRLLIFFTALLERAVCRSAALTQQGLQLHYQDQYVVMDNGILQITLSNPQGFVTGIRYHGIDNVLADLNKEHDRGYWDLVWNFPGKVDKKTKGTLDRIETTKLEVIVHNDEQIELSFKRAWNSSSQDKAVPINIEKRFVMLCNSSGFYTYAIFERLEGWPAVEVDNIRMAFKLNKKKFHYMAISDDRQRYMPLPDDRIPPRGQPLAYPEAVSLVHPVEPEFKGEVDDKYLYSCESKDLKVHGWISTNDSVGFWEITPSNEFRSAGPIKQFLNSHVGPTNLAIFHSTHYAGADLIISFASGEPWKKVFGPLFVYLNSFPRGVDPLLLWQEAKNQTILEAQSWPYSFVASEDFPSSNQRGKISGRLLVQDRFITSEYIPANGSYVGLAPPGEVGSWQRECKGYQFWTKSDADGSFTIDKVRPGAYNLYAWVPGFIGDYHNDTFINITAGCDIELGELVYEPPRDGPTVWEIGYPDRSAAEFYIPDPNPIYANKLYLNHSDKFRQYGLWERYAELYPHQDLVYAPGVDDYTKDWFFAQVTRKQENGTYKGTTWQIKFALEVKANETGLYKLRVALATAHFSELQIRVNDPSTNPPLFTSDEIGKDNTIARHGIHGLYRLFNVDLPASLVVPGNNNTIFLTQPLATSPFQGLMYDYIRLEGPPTVDRITGF